MHEASDIATAFLNEIGGEPLGGSGFEQEMPDTSFERTATKAKRQRSERKEERGNAE